MISASYFVHLLLASNLCLLPTSFVVMNKAWQQNFQVTDTIVAKCQSLVHHFPPFLRTSVQNFQSREVQLAFKKLSYVKGFRVPIYNLFPLFFVFSSILWGGWKNDYPQEDLAKFGYRSERKVEFLWNHAIYWHCGLNVATSTFYLPRNMATLGHFFQKKSFSTRIRLFSFGCKVAKLFHKRKTGFFTFLENTFFCESFCDFLWAFWTGRNQTNRSHFASQFQVTKP